MDEGYENYVLQQNAVTSKQEEDIRSYLALTGTVLHSNQLAYIRACLGCAHSAGYLQAANAAQEARDAALRVLDRGAGVRANG